MRSARPLARGRMRFIVIPSSTNTVETRNSSTSAPSLCSALAIADSSTFLMMSDIFHPLLTFGFLVRNVTFERSGRCEFAEFMTNHVFSYENRHMCFAVMNSNCKTHKFREYCGAARPCLDWTFVVLIKSGLYLLH